VACKSSLDYEEDDDGIEEAKEEGKKPQASRLQRFEFIIFI